MVGWLAHQLWVEKTWQLQPNRTIIGNGAGSGPPFCTPDPPTTKHDGNVTWLLYFAQYLWICIHGTSDVLKLANDLSDTLFPVTINDLQQPRTVVFLVSATSLLPLHDDVLILGVPWRCEEAAGGWASQKRRVPPTFTGNIDVKPRNIFWLKSH